jgi:hypothetical protein
METTKNENLTQSIPQNITMDQPKLPCSKTNKYFNEHQKKKHEALLLELVIFLHFSIKFIISQNSNHHEMVLSKINDTNSCSVFLTTINQLKKNPIIQRKQRRKTP